MPALTGFDKKWVSLQIVLVLVLVLEMSWKSRTNQRVGGSRSRRRKEADSLDGRPCPPPYVGGYASVFTPEVTRDFELLLLGRLRWR